MEACDRAQLVDSKRLYPLKLAGRRRNFGLNTSLLCRPSGFKMPWPDAYACSPSGVAARSSHRTGLRRASSNRFAGSRSWPPRWRPAVRRTCVWDAQGNGQRCAASTRICRARRRTRRNGHPPASLAAPVGPQVEVRVMSPVDPAPRPCRRPDTAPLHPGRTRRTSRTAHSARPARKPRYRLTWSCRRRGPASEPAPCRQAVRGSSARSPCAHQTAEPSLPVVDVAMLEPFCRRAVPAVH